MSFILDALKKLEQKRQHGTVPDLMTVHSEEHLTASKRAIWPYLLLAALVLNAAIILTWLRPWQVKQTVTAQTSETDAQTDAPAIVHRELSVPGPSEPVTTSRNLQEETPVTKNTDLSIKVAETPPAQNSAGAQTNSEVNLSDEAIAVTEADKSSPAPSGEKADVGTGSTDPEISASFRMDMSGSDLETLRNTIQDEQSLTDNSAPSVQEPIENTQAESENSVLEFNRLPDEIKKELPQITISGHIYSNNPSSRMATINGNIIKEGDKVSRGLTVDEITMSGIIFTYQGFRFNMRVF